MRRVLFLNVDGIAEERTTKMKIFNLDDFPDFNAVNSYPGLYVLYNTLEIEKNKSCIPFTEDSYNGSILIIKRKENVILNMTTNKFISLINKKKNVFGEEYSLSNSDSDPFDEICNKSGDC